MSTLLQYKKYLLASFCVLLGVFLFAKFSLAADISLSEVYVEGSSEWIEVYNSSSTAINIQNYQIKEGTGDLDSTRTISSSISIPANSVVVVNDAHLSSGFNFNDTSGTIIFKNSNFTELHRVEYGPDISLDASTTGQSLQYNGSFWFVDASNQGQVSMPVITVNPYTTSWTNQDITVTATSSGASMNATTTTFSANGSFDFVASNAVGGISTTTVVITNIDKIDPSITLLSPTVNATTTSQTISVNGTATDAGGSDLSVVNVSFDNGTTWLEATGTTTWSYTLNIATTTNEILVKATDNAGNSITASGPIITYQPNSPTSAATANATASTIDLSWTTPAAGVFAYSSFDVRYSTSDITENNFTSATQASGEPSPSAGAEQGFTISSLTSNTLYYFALRLTDVDGNTSGIATTTATTLASDPVDETAPSAVIDLSVSAGFPSSSNAVLTWSAKGDDGSSGIADSYIIKKSTGLITENNFNNAVTIYNNLTPQVSGSTENFTVSYLDANTKYYFAVKIKDEQGNTSLISNVDSITTANTKPTISDISQSASTITGTNFVNGDNTLIFTNSSNTFEIDATYVSATQLTFSIPTGTPAGSHNIKVINANGTSDLSTATYDVSESANIPTVTNISPLVASNSTSTSITISGANFTGVTGAVLDDGATTALTITNSTDTEITATVPSGVSIGSYNIKITNASGTNNLSSPKLSVVSTSIVTSGTNSDINTSEAILLSNTSTLPINIALQTDNKATSTKATSNSAEIQISLPQNASITSNGSNYTGVINPPRVIKPGVLADLDSSAVVFSMGSDTEKLNFDSNFTAAISLIASSEPIIWYYNSSTQTYELAGKAGSYEGVNYAKGGTQLVKDGNRYTMGLLLDHMSTFAVGVKPIITSAADSGEAGNSITVSGRNFHSDISVKVGSVSATVSSVNSSNSSLVYEIPSVSAGIYNLTLTNPDGMSATLSNGLEVTSATNNTTNDVVGGGGGGGSASLPAPEITTPATNDNASTNIENNIDVSESQDNNEAGEVLGIKVDVRALQIQNIETEAATVIKNKAEAVVSLIGAGRDEAAESEGYKKYTAELIKSLTTSEEQKNNITNFIVYGTPTTKILGAGERAGVVNSYKSTFGKLPQTQSEWEDVIKIGNGRWPTERSETSEKLSESAFKKIYGRSPDRSNPNDDAAVTIIAYGLRPTDRNLDSEKAAIKSFRWVYGYYPKSASAWDIVRAIAYSGATR